MRTVTNTLQNKGQVRETQSTKDSITILYGSGPTEDWVAHEGTLMPPVDSS